MCSDNKGTCPKQVPSTHVYIYLFIIMVLHMFRTATDFFGGTCTRIYMCIAHYDM